MFNRRRIQKFKIPCALSLLVFTLFLWSWTSRIYYRDLPTLGCRIRIPFVSMQLTAREDGIHFLTMQNSTTRFPEISFRKQLHFGRSGYHYGTVCNLLGIVFAISTTEIIDYDVFISPYAALVLPYWLLIVISCGVLINHAPLRRHLVPFLRLSFTSGCCGTVVFLLMIMANLVPQISMSIPNVQPQGLSEWAMVTISPKTVYVEAMFEYGYPSVYLYNGVIRGKTVSFFHGYTVGWKQHKIMENLIIAIFFALATIVTVNITTRFFHGKSVAEARERRVATGDSQPEGGENADND